MKILAIRGKNLASLEGEFEVDFRVEPLRSAGVFAITGSTGAGKSTILDAMCIALYERTPRLDSIKNSTAIEHTASKAISEKDPRTMLRRGKSDAYAEVDFRAIDGNEYRMRWSISRTKESSTGNFRKTSYDLTNLTTNVHELLTAKSSKTRIPELIGLEYEQFTRAVLLAQGDFSAFLKADESEKASILETLTGTDIYSRISQQIYTRTQEIKRELALLEEKRHTLQLLNNEEIEELEERRKTLAEEHEENKVRLEILRIKRSWAERLQSLTKLLAEAEGQLTQTQEHFATMQPVIDKLKLIDSVQDIRDDYISLLSARSQHNGCTQQLALLSTSIEEKTKGIVDAEKAVAQATEIQEKCNLEQLAAQPRIMEASALEKQFTNDKRTLDTQREELKKLADERKKYFDCIDACNKNIKQLAKEREEKELWFAQHKMYSDAVPMIPSIVANIKATANEKMHQAAKKKSLAMSTAMLAGYEKRMATALEEEERLKQTMSSEIATLRSRLVKGEPCPVCGSRHHEIVAVASLLLDEKELKKAKDDNRKLLAMLEKNITDSKSEIAKLQGAIELHVSNIDQYKKVTLGYLKAISNAESIIERSTIVEELTTLATNWNSYKERLAAIAEDLSVECNKQQLYNTRLSEIDAEYKQKSEQTELFASNIEKEREKLIAILGCHATAKEMQQHYNRLIAEANQSFAKAAEAKSNIDLECNKLKGQIAEKSTQLADAAEKIKTFEKRVDAYLAVRTDAMDAAMLEQLLAVGSNEVSAMRRSIEALNKSITTIKATIAERKQNIDEHYKAPTRPDEQESIDMLDNAIAAADRQSVALLEQASQVNAILLKDADNKKLFSKYSDEYEQRRVTFSHWSTLNAMFGSAKGDTLMKLAQGYTLDILLSVANVHLADITGRYKLARISDRSLGIKVIDLEMMEESRSAHTLSGGETFIVSLALSLALSSISSSRMSIGSLFIDEGFGSLDSDTLQTAIMALEKLHSQGRKIGVISHLSEMLEQIPVKIKVKKTAQGRSKIEIIDNKDVQ